MSSYTEKIIVDDWYFYITNGANSPVHQIGLWAKLHNGLEIPIINSPSQGSLITSADPNYPETSSEQYGNGMKVPLSDNFLEVLGHVIHFVEHDWRFPSMPAAWMGELPEKFPKTEVWAINQIVKAKTQRMLPRELELLCEEAIIEDSQRQLEEFEEFNSSEGEESA